MSNNPAGRPIRGAEAIGAAAPYDEFWDQPGHGAEFVAEVLNFRKKNGKLDLGKAYYVLAHGWVDADKIGRGWTSTRRRLSKPRGFRGRARPETESI